MLGCFSYPQQIGAIWPDCISQLFDKSFLWVCSADALTMEAVEEPNMIK